MYSIHKVSRRRSFRYEETPCNQFLSLTHSPAAMHRDGAFVLTDEERSVHTLMVYLNNESEFKGGDTVFYLDAQHPLPIRGSLGKGLVFKHNLWHEVCGLDDFFFFFGFLLIVY